MRVFQSLFVVNFIIFGSIPGAINSQTPANDLNWQLDSAKSDEFNSPNINISKWHILDCPSGDCCNYGGGTAFEKGNVSDSGGLLRLRVDGPGYAPIPCNRETYATGGLVSDSFNYSYGYFEIYARLPGFYSNGLPCGSKFEPDFWTAAPVISDTSCVLIHNEIDIMEDNGLQYANTQTISSGWWYQDGHCGIIKFGQILYASPIPLFTGFHKYAVAWDKNAIIFYFDNTPYKEVYNSPVMTMNPQEIFIDLQLSDTGTKFCSGITFPQYMSVDYFRYYTLNLDCGISATLLTNADIAAYTYSVKSDITFGNGANSISLNNTDVKYFRAVNSITINGTFTAPLGSELGLIPTACP